MKKVKVLDEVLPPSTPESAGAVRVLSTQGGAQGGVELLLLVPLQVEGLQRVHGPVKQRVIEQNLDRTHG